VPPFRLLNLVLCGALSSACSPRDSRESLEPRAPVEDAPPESTTPVVTRGGDQARGPAFVALAWDQLRIVLLHDGGHAYPPDFVLGSDLAADPAARAELGLQNPGDSLWLPYSAMAVVTPESTLLIDAGGARSLFPEAGRLAESMALAGLSRDQVDTVVLTHAHPDHIGGLVKDGEPAFPHARILLTKDEHDHWLSPELCEGDGMEAEMARYVAATFALLGPAIDVVVPPAEVMNGVKLLPIVGHTPGHGMVEVATPARSLWHVGDLFLLPLFVTSPDLRPATIPGERAALLLEDMFRIRALAEEEGPWVVASHLPPFPSLGTIASDHVWRSHPL